MKIKTWETPSERFELSLTKDNLWLYIFILLQKKELYPYEIRDAINEKFGFLPGKMTAYVVLKKLETAGYVDVVKTNHSSEGPERTYYKITDEGIDEFKKAKELHKKMGKLLFDTE